jgi:hypothetical protein
MSNLSTFKGGASGAAIGDFIPGVITYWGDNPTISSKEYLRTGVLKPYTSTYADLITLNKTFGVVNCNAPANTWITAPNVWVTQVPQYPVNFLYKVEKSNNTTFHFIFLSDSVSNANIRLGSSFSSAPSNTVILNRTTFEPQSNLLVDSITYNAKSIILATSRVWHANTTSYANSFQFVSGGFRHLIANTSHVFSIRSDVANTQSGSIVSSPDGYTWTNVTPSVSMTTVRRAAFCNAANLIVYANATGNVWSSNNGFTLTSVGRPNNMPTVVPEIRYGNSMWVASSPNSTFISVGEGKLLKVNSGPTYTVVDLTTLPLTPENHFSKYSMPRIVYDGFRFILIDDYYNAKYFYSTDEGLTWTRDFDLYTGNTNYLTHMTNYGTNYVDSKLFVALGDSVTLNVAPFDATVNVAQSAPNYIGTFDEYSSDIFTTTYLRIA